ncbi:MAG: DNA primase DnaG [Candidatus Nanohaloarchaea archaeon]
MGKVAQNSAKYVIKVEMRAGGLVEKPDIVGAIFGQTEGLLGEELDLRELQEKGRVGRIDVQVEVDEGSSSAEIKIPSSLDSTETALLAASLETIERVGPSSADIKVKEIQDQRTSKRDFIVKRAKQLLKDIKDEKPEKNRITDEVKREVRTSEITEYRGFQAGPEAEVSDEVVLVEGKADLLNLMSYGIKNAVAIGGTSIPEDIEEISDGKTVTAFLDGDRGGELILKELRQKASVEYIARAPDKKEVEELGKEKVFECIRDKQPLKFVREKEVEQEKMADEKLERMSQILEDLVGTRAVCVLDENLEEVDRMPGSDFEQVRNIGECESIVFDGEIDVEEIETVEESGASYIIGMEKTGRATSGSVKILTRKDLEKPEIKE